MNAIKNGFRQLRKALKRTPFFLLYHTLRPRLLRRRLRRDFRRWTEIDEKRRVFYRELVKPGDIVFDVGANLGNRSKVFLELEAKVIAFEPQKICAAYLEAFLADHPRFTLDRRALGAAPGTAEMMLSDEHVLSSLSPEWIRATQASGRFRNQRWAWRQPVTITTLDEAIATYGIPSFVKIDVEGYEPEVVSGLTRPIPCLSLEFTPERIEATYACLEHLDSLAETGYQLSLGEAMTFTLDSWVGPQKIRMILSEVDPKAFGDVYVRCL